MRPKNPWNGWNAAVQSLRIEMKNPWNGWAANQSSKLRTLDVRCQGWSLCRLVGPSRCRSVKLLTWRPLKRKVNNLNKTLNKVNKALNKVDTTSIYNKVKMDTSINLQRSENGRLWWPLLQETKTLLRNEYCQTAWLRLHLESLWRNTLVFKSVDFRDQRGCM